MPESVPRPRQVAACPLAALAALLGSVTAGEVKITSGRAGSAGEVTGATHASDAVRPGDLFAALPSLTGGRHGATFLPAALVVPDPRAVLGPVAARVYGDPAGRLEVIGVTGTAGKTSTVYLIEAGLRAAGRRPALLSTVQTHIGEMVLDSVRTTPEATDLHALLAVAAEAGVDAVAMEVSSHALALERVGGVRFAVGAWTNFGTDHLDFHPDLDDYFAAKARLFDGRCRVELVNADDPALRQLASPPRLSFSAAGATSATWYATDHRPEGYGQRFVAHGPAGPVPAGVAQPGRHSVANALLAVAILSTLGMAPGAAAAAVAAAPGVPGRLEVVTSGEHGPLGVVDYAHKPDAIVAALAALRPVADRRGGRLVCVLGAGGERDTGKRPDMGAAAARLADLVVVTDDNPRGEDPAAIRAAVLGGARATGPDRATGVEVVEVADRRAAIEAAVARSGPADVLALLGKGHERGQEIAGAVRPFDDRIELAEALAGTRGGVR